MPDPSGPRNRGHARGLPPPRPRAANTPRAANAYKAFIPSTSVIAGIAAREGRYMFSPTRERSAVPLHSTKVGRVVKHLRVGEAFGIRGCVVEDRPGAMHPARGRTSPLPGQSADMTGVLVEQGVLL